MDPLGSKLLADLLHGRHPGDGQVAVLQDHPAPVLHGRRDQLGGNGALHRREGGGEGRGYITCIMYSDIFIGDDLSVI